MSIHAHRLLCICPDYEPAEEACEDIEHPLQPLRLGRGGESSAGIKICFQVPYQQTKTLPALIGCHHCRQPVADYGVHDPVEERGGQGYPCVTLWQHLKGRLKYSPALATMFSRSQYVRSIWIAQGMTYYAERLSRYLYQSRASYAFWKSKNTLKSTASLMDVRS